MTNISSTDEINIVGSYDVIIIGAGPAGASCAKALREKDVEVLVIEKHSLPRYKTCSGILFGQTQVLLKKYFGAEAPREVRCQGDDIIPKENVLEWTKDGFRPYIWELDKDGEEFPKKYQNIWRNKFDKWLLDQSGAEYIDSSMVVGLEEEEDRVLVKIKTETGDTMIYACRYLVGADGVASIVKRNFDPKEYAIEEVPNVASLQSYYKIESLGKMKPNQWLVFLMKEIGEIICCVHRKEDYLTLHVGGLIGRDLRESMEKFKALLAKELDVKLGEKWRDERCRIEISSPFHGRKRLLLTGEAGGFMYLNGEGISAAIDSGYRCGQAVADALVSGEDAVVLYKNDTQDIVKHIEKCHQAVNFFAI